MYYVLKDKKAIPVSDVIYWGKWFEKNDDRIVKQETLDNGLWVSTVFLGIDHNFGFGKPLLFETMVFKSKDNLDEIDMDRYSTWTEAEKGHKKLVEKYKNEKMIILR